MPILALGTVLLVVILGHAASFLAQNNKLTPAQIEALGQRTKIPPRPPVAFHRVSELAENAPRDFAQSPTLARLVESAQIPPVAERLPRNPLVISPSEQNGPYGGVWRQFATGPADIGSMTTLFYETLIRRDPMLRDFLPNLASHWSVEEDGRAFTFRLREGIRWSDGAAFTADDILFWYEHVLLNSELTPIVPQPYIRGGEIMTVEKIDDFAIRIRFAEPHGLFLQWVANPLMMELVSYPAHYFRQFHPAFADPAELRRLAQVDGFSFWHQRFLNKADWHNAEKPTLAAWQLTRPPPARQIVFDRNPFYWKIDSAGNQLPYIDRLTFEIVSPETMTLRFLRGDAGFQNRHTDLRDFALLMENRVTGNYRLLQWISSTGSGVLMPNLNHRDSILRQLLSDRRFRVALSHSINRQEISDAVYSGMGTPMQMAPTPGTPLYRDKYAKPFTEFDPQKANRLLDEIGLVRRDPNGIRLRPDGKPLRLDIEMFPGIADAGTMQLVASHWKSVGIESDVNPIAQSLFYVRMPARLHDVAVGGNSSMNTPMLDHMYFVPIGLGARHALDYAAWFISNGERGSEPPPEMRHAVQLYRQIEQTADRAQQEKLAHQILAGNARNLWLIGLVGDLPGLVLVHNNFRNVPDRAVVFGSAGVTAPEIYAIDSN